MSHWSLFFPSKLAGGPALRRYIRTYSSPGKTLQSQTYTLPQFNSLPLQEAVNRSLNLPLSFAFIRRAMSTSNRRGGRGRGGGGGGGGRGGKHRQPQSREVTVSKALSFLLRHGAKDEGVQLDEGGWANVRDVVRAVQIVISRVTVVCCVSFLLFRKTSRRPRLLFRSLGLVI